MRRSSPYSQIILFGVACILIALAVVILSLFSFTKHNNKHGVEIEVRITEITSEYDTDNENYNHTVYVEYQVDGVTYNRTLDTYISTYRVGQTLTAYYNPQNPYELWTRMESWVLWIWIAVSSVFIITGICLIVHGIKKQRTASIY